MKVSNLIDTIKKVGDKNGIISLETKLKLNNYDKKAVELIELLSDDDYSIREGIEIFQTAICWLGIFSSSITANKEMED